MIKMKFDSHVLIDEYPNNDKVTLCIFTRPLFPIQYRNRWNKKIQFACSPSAINVFRLFRVKGAFQIQENNRFKINGNELDVRYIEQDAFGSYMLIIQWMDEKDRVILYTGQFTDYRKALVNGLADNWMDKITDIYIDNTIAHTEHANSLEAACDNVENYLKEYDGYKVYLDFENLFGYEELLVYLARRKKIKIQLLNLQREAMRCGDNLKYFDFDGDPNLKVFYRPDRNNWCLDDYKRFFIKNKCVYLKFIATQRITKISTENTYMHHDKRTEIKSKFAGFHYIAYSPHATKHTIANFIRLLEPSRIYPLYLPDQMEHKWSYVMPKEVIPLSAELVVPIESEIDLNRADENVNATFRQIQKIASPQESEPEDSETSSKLRLPDQSRPEKSFLASSSDEDYENEYDDIRLITAISDEYMPQPALPRRISNVDAIVISDDDSPIDDIQPSHQYVNAKKESSIAIVDTLISTESNSDHNDGDRDGEHTENQAQLTNNRIGMEIVDNPSDSNDHNAHNEVQSDALTAESMVNVIPNHAEKENSLNGVNNIGQAPDEDIETARAHCPDSNVLSRATQSNRLNPSKICKQLKRRNPLSLRSRETHPKFQYLPETDEESEDDNVTINSLTSSSNTSLSLSPIKFD